MALTGLSGLALKDQGTPRQVMPSPPFSCLPMGPESDRAIPGPVEGAGAWRAFRYRMAGCGPPACWLDRVNYTFAGAFIPGLYRLRSGRSLLPSTIV